MTGQESTDFSLRLSGFSGHPGLREPLNFKVSASCGSTLPDIVLPNPIPEETSFQTIRRIREEYLSPDSFLKSSHNPILNQYKVWEIDARAAYNIPPAVTQSPISHILQADWLPPWDRRSNWIPNPVEVPVSEFRLPARRPGESQNFSRTGSAAHQPHLPGGFLKPEAEPAAEEKIPEGALNGEWALEVLNPRGSLLTVPPGFSKGITFPHAVLENDQVPAGSLVKVGEEEAVTIATLRFDSVFGGEWDEEEEDKKSDDMEGEMIAAPVREISTPGSPNVPHDGTLMEKQDALLDEMLTGPSGSSIWNKEKISKMKTDLKDEEEWAIMRPVPDIDEKFRKILPEIAMKFPFELDVFQKEAVFHLENHDSVFVAAHTSAGKTVVAEYAFALATKHCTRAIYTSPIKTISNQKFRDFGDVFDVGLLTGDVSIRPEASCLIMTTEILRSMLYKGADVLRDVEWVVFDEVHYVNDVDRGVVWEEVIIMLPDHIGMVLLSATVPNTFEFADWIGRTKRKKIYVTGTRKRPVPLEHCLFYSGEFYKIYEGSDWIAEGMKGIQLAHKAKNTSHTRLTAGSGTRGGRSGGAGRGISPAQQTQVANAGGSDRGRRNEPNQWMTLVNKLLKNQLLPVVVFCFSKNKCDQSAEGLSSADLTNKGEKSEIVKFCDLAFSRLKGTDRKLPQVVRVSNLLKRGIGVHHAGLLPMVKEVVEMLFCRGVIKILFSTETFAMGVNAPARSVAFHGLRKHDGRTYRTLLPGEYTQMAGRAGRRGLDTVGTVIICCWEDVPEESELRNLLTGKPTKLESQFRLTYNMILNLLRVEDLTVEDMLKRSFAEFHAMKNRPRQQELLKKGELLLEGLKQQGPISCILGEPTIEEYYSKSTEVKRLTAGVQAAVLQSRSGQQALTTGRCIIAETSEDEVPCLGMILKGPYGEGSTRAYLAMLLHQEPPPLDAKIEPTAREMRERENFGEVSVLGTGPRGVETVNMKLPFFSTSAGVKFVLLRLEARRIVGICTDKFPVNVEEILKERNSAEIASAIGRLEGLELRHFPGLPPLLSPVKDLRLNDLDLVEQYNRREELLAGLVDNKCMRCNRLSEHYNVVKRQTQLRDEISDLKHRMSDDSLQQMPDFNQRVTVLQRLGYVDGSRVVQLKGRVACEINSGDELISTEAIFDNQFDDLDAAECVALLSSLVFQQRDASEPQLTPRLAAARDRLYETALNLGVEQMECELPVTPEDFAAEKLKFGLMEVVYEWAKGTPFADICELTNVPEGSIVRTIVRLDETCREFKNAAGLVGNSSLFKKMEDSSLAIKRDIVFAASLYVTSASN